MACRQTLADNLKYIWVDTYCIDKSSSSELSEAINSMYTWYSEAECCYAYLNDVQISQYDRASGKRLTLDDARISRAKAVEGIVNSAWFSRAWTLQELIAPLQLVFFDVQFRRLATRIDVAADVQRVHGIPPLD